MGFPASPADGDTHTVRGIIHTYDDATKTWKRPVPTYVQEYQGNARPPMFDGTVAYRNDSGAPPETIAKGPNGTYNLRNAVVIKHEYFSNGSCWLGIGYEGFKHIQIRITYRNLVGDTAVWFRLQEVGAGWVRKWGQLTGYINWGSGGELPEARGISGEWLRIMKLYRGRDAPIQIDIIRPDLDLNLPRAIMIRSMYPRGNNDSVESIHAQAITTNFGKVHSAYIEVDDTNTDNASGIATVVGWR